MPNFPAIHNQCEFWGALMPTLKFVGWVVPGGCTTEEAVLGPFALIPRAYMRIEEGQGDIGDDNDSDTGDMPQWKMCITSAEWPVSVLDAN